MPRGTSCRLLSAGVFLQVLLLGIASAQGQLILGPEQLVQADNLSIDVPGYSVPSFADWNSDGLKDLIVGQGSGSITPKVRVYLNVGTALAPQFSTYFYAQSNGADLTVPGSGCLGLFPRVVYWNDDNDKDLLVGLSDGTVKIYLNIGNQTVPTFDGGTTLQVGELGSEQDLNVAARATPMYVDWNNDNLKDLVVGAYDGKIHVYIHCGCLPQYPTFWQSPPGGMLAQQDGADLIVPQMRSSPVLFDLDNDQKPDLLVGDTAGQLLFYRNVSADDWPSFSTYTLVEADGVPIDLPDSARSRPSVCDWTGDGLPDVLIGGSDGLVRLYEHAFCGDDQHPYPQGDFDQNCMVNWVDFSIFAAHWLDSPCPAPDHCQGTDINHSGQVNWGDFAIFGSNWLECTAPGGCD